MTEPRFNGRRGDPRIRAGSAPSHVADGASDHGREEPAVGRRTGVLCPDALKVVDRLVRFGHVAYLCGGCVRDLLLEARPKDFDIVTDATPRQVKRLFRNSRIIGRRFRLVHVTFPDKILEVSTFRSLAEPNVSGEDLLIHQDNTFGTPHEDAWRRDFTVNGLFYDLTRGRVIDYVGGLVDLDRRVIETIGDPFVRFREDPVRMLRAVKFASRLGFRLADDVYEAMIDCREEIRKAAPPRILEELFRFMNLGGARDSVRMLLRTGLLEQILPELAHVLGEFAARADRSAWDGYFGVLAAFDEVVREGVPASNARLLAFLFAPLFEAEMQSGAMPAGPDDDDALTPIVQRLRMARRDAWHIRQILHAQGRFLRRAREGRRKMSVHQFVTREYFEDAYFLFRMRARAFGGEWLEDVARWDERLSDASPSHASD